MKLVKAYWNQYWHCFLPRVGHRMLSSGLYLRILPFICIKRNYLGCECGKDFYKSDKLTEQEEMLIKVLKCK